MAVLSHNQIDEAIFSNPNENHIIKANYKCLLCWTKVEIIDERFATAVVNKGRNPICPICGKVMECINYEVVERD